MELRSCDCKEWLETCIRISPSFWITFQGNSRMAQFTPNCEKAEPHKNWREEEEEGWRPAELQDKSQEPIERMVSLHNPLETGCFVKIIRIRLEILWSKLLLLLFEARQCKRGCDLMLHPSLLSSQASFPGKMERVLHQQETHLRRVV